METNVKFRIGNRLDTDSLLTDAVKMAYDELVTAIRVPENQETASGSLSTGVSTYVLPTDMFSLETVRDATSDKTLKQISRRQYSQKKLVVPGGPPMEYHWWRGEIIFFPTPDVSTYVVTIDYVKRLSALSASTSLSALPREWDEIIMQAAFVKMLSWLDQVEDAAREDQRLSKMIGNRMNRLNETLRDMDSGAAPQLGAPTAWKQR
jgi:hypothetical protein